MDLQLMQELLKKALSNGGEYADIFFEQRKNTSIQLEDEKIEKIIEGSFSGIGIRLIHGKKTAYAYSNDFSKKALMEMATIISRVASKGKVVSVINMKKRNPDVRFFIKKIPNSVPITSKVDLVKTGNHVARKFSTKIKQASIIYKDTVQKIKIFTSEGFFTEDERIYTIGLVQIIASDDGIIQTGYEPVGGLIGYELFEETPIEKIAIKASERAVMMLKAKRAKGGRMPVVISSEAGGTMIHEAIGHGLEADLAQQGLSVYSGKIGTPIASNLITVIDDGTIPNKRGSFSFDDEGTPSKSNVLVKDGILLGYMYDKYTAMIDGVLSTGNGRRESYEYKPMPRMTNTFIAPGKSTPDEVIRPVKKGLFVKKMGGGQVNTVTGDFVFEVQEGYLIENGAIGDPVRGATLIGNGPEILKAIDAVASDLGFSVGTCGKDSQGVPVSDGMPTLRIPEMVVGGEVGN
jgi:TldD protein